MSLILIIEDDTSIRETLIDLLQLQGFETIEAEDGETGCIKAISQTPDLILSDINMPKMDGFEVLEVLNNLMDKNNIPVFLFISARVEPKDVRHGMSLGADDYLLKPFSNNDLVKAINSKLEKRKKIESSILRAERNRISAELHDNTQQLLCSALIGFKKLEDKMDHLKQNEKQIYKTSLEILNVAIGDIRNISSKIVDNKSKILKEMLANIINPLQNSSSTKFQFNYALQHLQISNKIEIEITRIIQEFINNILKHAKAKEVEISLRESTEGDISIFIKDDGKGFDIKKESDGIGLKNIHTRVQQLSGAININSTKGIGTSININIPLNKL